MWTRPYRIFRRRLNSISLNKGTYGGRLPSREESLRSAEYTQQPQSNGRLPSGEERLRSARPVLNKGTPHRGRGFDSGGAGLLFIAPSLAGVAVFVLIPFGDVVRRSFLNSMGERFVGLHNYVSVLENQAFQLAAKNTLKFVLICIPALVFFSLLLAAAVQTVRWGREGFKTCFLLPMAVPAASVVLIWQLLFHQNGLVNNLLMKGGFSPVDFMNTGAAFWVLTVSYMWKNLGYDMILWMAGLSGIPRDLYEAAALDGAGPVKSFFFVTLPNLLPVLSTILVLSLLNSFKVFREAYLVAGDHPHTSMYLLQHLFNNWFTAMDMEKLSAGAVMLALTVYGLTALLQRTWGDR